MSISGVGGASGLGILYAAAQSSSGGSSAASASSGALAQSSTSADDAVKSFQDYMKETPAQRMIDAWLKAHHLTEKELNALPPAQRDAILKEMTSDIKNEIKQKTDSALINQINILA
jgi:hypothetical protein